MTLERLINRRVAGDTVVAALGAGRRLRREVRQRAHPEATARLLLAHCGEDVDALTQLLLIRALDRVPGSRADAAFVAMLGDGDAGLRQHAAWALAERPPVAAALPGLLRLEADGGFGTVLAREGGPQRGLRYQPVFAGRDRSAGFRLAGR